MMRGFSVTEYALLIILIIGALIAMKGYLQNGMMGQYRKAGANYGYLRQYDAKRTRECSLDGRLVDSLGAQLAYSARCYDNILNASCDSVGRDSVENAQTCSSITRACTSSERSLCPSSCCVIDVKYQCAPPCQGV